MYLIIYNSIDSLAEQTMQASHHKVQDLMQRKINGSLPGS